MQLILSFGVVLGCSFAGECLHALLPLPVPAGVYGLCILLVLLLTGVVKPDFIRSVSTFLISMMPLMFVPSTAGIMQYWDVLGPVLVPFIVAVTVITAVVMVVSGRITQKLEGGHADDRLSE